MSSIIYVIFTTLSFCIEAVCLLMMVRAILSWFPGVGRGSKVVAFIYNVTESVVAPVRTVMNKISFVRTFPLDLSFLVTLLLLYALQSLLYVGYTMLI